MPTRMLFVGLDAADPRLLGRWSGEGALPRIASFTDTASELALANPLAVIGGGVWQDLSTGRSCGRAGLFFPARQLRTGETAPRQVRKDEVDRRAFWTAASDAGLRVAVVDVPHAVEPPSLNGVFVGEWGTHDRLYGEQSIPPQLLAELRDRHGDYPLWARGWPRVTTAVCDGHDGSTEQYEQLLDDLLAGIERKTALLLDVLGREQWDLFTCAFSEGQCSGHQLFHFLEDGAPAGHQRLADAIRTVYARLDRSLGALIDAAGPGASVAVVATHAFVRPTGGTQLIPEVLVRLGYGSGRGVTAGARTKIPAPVRRVVRRLLPGRARRSVQARVGTLPNPLDFPSTRAAALDGDRCSWIRLNLAGREPYGSVQPGPEADEALAEIRAALLELEHPSSGERIVVSVQSAQEAFGAESHPDVPDLIVNFRDDLGVLDACRSERVGLVRVPYHGPARRTGAHPPVPTSAWIRGEDGRAPGIVEGAACDLAPTLLARLGVPAPEWMDGRVLA